MASIELGKKLKEAREMAGLNLIEASRRLGFPNYQTLSNIEDGKREIKASELSLFAKTYFCDIGYFLGEKPMRSDDFSLLWRKSPRENVKKEIEAKIFQLCENYNLVESLLELKKENEFYFLDVKLDDIRTIYAVDSLADKVASLLCLGKRPAFTIQKVLEQKYSVKLIYHALSDIGSAATTINSKFGAVIIINSNEAPWRRNYNFAHELFHLITWNFVSHKDLEENSVYFQDIEKKAERFASTLLLPSDEVKNEIMSRINNSESILNSSDLVDIAREFGVSTVALLYRLANLNLLNWEKANKLACDASLLELDRDLRKKDWMRPVSERFISLATRCLRKGLLSRGKFAKLLDIDRYDIDEFISNYGLMEVEGDSVEIMAS